VTDLEAASELPESLESVARSRLSSTDQLRMGMKSLERREASETDQQLDDDTVTLRGLSDEALEYVLNTYDVELVE